MLPLWSIQAPNKHTECNVKNRMNKNYIQIIKMDGDA